MADHITSRKLKASAHVLDNAVRIGKLGMTAGILHEIEKNVEKHRLIKVKILKSSPTTREEVVKKIEDELALRIVSVVGKVITVTNHG